MTKQDLEWSVGMTWVFLIIGVLMVLFADPLSVYWIKGSLSKGQVFFENSWSESVALNFRFMGCLSFIAGMTERIVTEIKQVRASQ